MRRNRFVVKAAPLALAAALTVGCGSSEPAAPKPVEKIVPTTQAEMSPEEAGGMAPSAAAEGSLAPASKAPHGGTVVALGKAAHLEFVHDPSSGMLTAYVLDAAGTATMRSPAKSIAVKVTPPGGSAVSLDLMSTANGLTGDTVGNSSQFGGTNAALKGVTTFSGVVTSAAAGGETFTNVSFTYPR